MGSALHHRPLEVGSKLPLLLYADVQMHMPMTHHNDAGAREAGLEFNWQHWCALLQVTAAQNFTLRGTGMTNAMHTFNLFTRLSESRSTLARVLVDGLQTGEKINPRV